MPYPSPNELSQAVLNEIAALTSQSSATTKTIKSEGDLPALTSVGGVQTHVLEEFLYRLDNNVSIANPIGHPGAGKTATASATQGDSIALMLLDDTDTNAYYEIFVENKTNPGNIIGGDATLIVS